MSWQSGLRGERAVSSEQCLLWAQEGQAVRELCAPILIPMEEETKARELT